MQGVHAFEPKTKASIDLDSFVAEGHFLRRIDGVLDLSFVRELTAPRYAVQQGRPSIDPEVFFRMPLVAYFYGIAKGSPPVRGSSLQPRLPLVLPAVVWRNTHSRGLKRSKKRSS
jgi:hypothetical protein